MIAVDTNVLVRLMVDDDAEQAGAGRRLVERAMATDGRLFVSTPVLCELAWVLRSRYGVDSTHVARSLAWLAEAHPFVIQSRQATLRALTAFEAGRGDFADYLIRELAREHGATAVATLDRALLPEDGFVEPDPASWTEPPSLRETPPPYRLVVATS